MIADQGWLLLTYKHFVEVYHPGSAWNVTEPNMETITSPGEIDSCVCPRRERAELILVSGSFFSD